MADNPALRMRIITPARVLLFLFTLSYMIAGFALLSSAGNNEFLLYLVGLSPLLFLAFWAQIHFEFPLWMLWLFSILMALHLAGGSIMVHGDVLYNLVLISIPNWTGLTIWKFDQLVHPYGAASIALISYVLLSRATSLPKVALFVIAFMVANGAGALNEVIEFMTKISTAHSTVGGYYNTALDLFFNTLGAALGSFLGTLYPQKSEP